MNLQPSEAEAGFDIRVPPSADLGDLWRRIREEWAPASCNLTHTVSQNSKTICLLFCSLFSSVGRMEFLTENLCWNCGMVGLDAMVKSLLNLTHKTRGCRHKEHPEMIYSHGGHCLRKLCTRQIELWVTWWFDLLLQMLVIFETWEFQHSVSRLWPTHLVFFMTIMRFAENSIRVLISGHLFIFFCID